MKNSILLVLLSINLLPIKSQNNPPYWNGLIEWQTKYEESSGLREKFSQEFLSHDGFKATGPNYVLYEILNKRYIPFIDSTFYITYTMPYRIKFTEIFRQPDRKTYIDTMKIRLKFENGHCVSRQIKYTIIEPTINGYSLDIEYYETIESYFYKKYGPYQYNERVDSISIYLSYNRIGRVNSTPLSFTHYIKLNYDDSDSLLYKRKGWNYSFSKLNSIFANSWGTNPQICVYHLSHYSMGLNQGLIYLFDPIHQWQAYDKKYEEKKNLSSYGLLQRRLYNNKFVGVNFTRDSQYVKQQSIFFSNTITNSFCLPDASNFDLHRNKTISISSYSLRPMADLKDSTEVLEKSVTDIFYNKQKELSKIKSNTAYQFINGTQTQKTQSTINYISPYHFIETYYLKEGKKTKKFKINYIISR